MNAVKQRAGRLGGLQTCLRHGREQLRAWGKLGGRPRKPTIAVIEARARELQENEGGRNTSGRLARMNAQQLKREWARRRRSMPALV